MGGQESRQVTASLSLRHHASPSPPIHTASASLGQAGSLPLRPHCKEGARPLFPGGSPSQPSIGNRVSLPGADFPPGDTASLLQVEPPSVIFPGLLSFSLQLKGAFHLGDYRE